MSFLQHCLLFFLFELMDVIFTTLSFVFLMFGLMDVIFVSMSHECD